MTHNPQIYEWIEPEEIDIPEDLLEACGGRPLIASALIRRGIVDAPSAQAFFHPEDYPQSPPAEIPGIEAIAARLMEAIETGEPVCVWGDFDVDGQTSTTLLVSTLSDLGADVSYHIPVRGVESHGVLLPVLKQILAEGAPRLDGSQGPPPKVLLTCDTGIAAIESIGYAQENGVDVLITDHHDLPDEGLPPALAIANPKMLPPDHPLSSLPGVGVAYKLAQALYARAERPGEADQYLDLVALGLVADVATLYGDARPLLQQGMALLRENRRLGLKALLELTETNPSALTEEHIGFMIGPRLNALGRLADANLAVEFLTTRDLARSRVLAAQLEGLNAHRKMLTDQVTQAAMAQIEKDPSVLEDSALVLSNPAWPGGVIGIVASRLVEQFHRPVVLITAPEGEAARGSARSVEGCNITAAIAAQKDLLIRFGGHPMAAGLSLDPENIPDFRRRLSQTVREMTGVSPGNLLRPTLALDGCVPLNELTLKLVDELERLAPYGPGNLALTLYAPRVQLKTWSPMGRTGDHLQLIVADESQRETRVIWWQGGGRVIPQGTFDLAYRARASSYNGRREVQIEWVDARPCVEAIDQPEPPQIKWVDYRQVEHPLALLTNLLAETPTPVWCEGAQPQLGKAEAEGYLADRLSLRPSPNLILWTAPPGPVELRAVLERVTPEKVILFAVDPQLDQPEAFLQRLSGMVKYSLSHLEGRLKVSVLAAAAAQREDTIRTGLEWLAGKGFIEILSENKDEMLLGKGAGEHGNGQSEIARRLRGQLEETAAYRAYFQKARVEGLA